jgi:hypothetical protein
MSNIKNWKAKFGRNTVDWLESIKDQSRDNYISTIQNFEIFCEQSTEVDWMQKIKDYCKFLHETMKCTTISSVNSILSSYIQFEKNYSNESTRKSTLKLINNWRTNETIKKSKVINILIEKNIILFII